MIDSYLIFLLIINNFAHPTQKKLKTDDILTQKSDRADLQPNTSCQFRYENIEFFLNQDFTTLNPDKLLKSEYFTSNIDNNKENNSLNDANGNGFSSNKQNDDTISDKTKFSTKLNLDNFEEDQTYKMEQSHLKEDKTKDFSNDKLILLSFRTPEQVKSSNIYSLFLELLSQYLDLSEYLNVINHFNNEIDNMILKIKATSYESLENCFISIVDKLIKFNEICPNICFWQVIYVRNRYETLRYSYKNKQITYDIDVFIDKNGFREEFALGFKSFLQILEQLKEIQESSHRINLQTVSWCRIFNTIAKINEYYNKNLKEKVNLDLSNFILSIFANNKQPIDCSKYIQHDNFLAYLIFNMFLQFNFRNGTKYKEFNLKLLCQKLEGPSFVTLLFLFLNEPVSILALMNNTEKFEKFTKRIETKLKIDYETELFSKFFKVVFCKNNEFFTHKTQNMLNSNYKDHISKISNYINDNILEYYQIAYDELKNILEE